MSQLVINTSFNIDLGFELAPMHKRIFATLIDYFILGAYVYVFYYLFYSNWRDSYSYYKDGSDELKDFVGFIGILPVIFYFLYSEALMGGETIGKRLMNLRVISLDGNKPSMSQLTLRWMLRTIDFSASVMLVGIISSAVTKNGQRIGDLAAGTTVVSNTLPYSINDTIFKHVSQEYKVQFSNVLKLSDRDINTINNILLQHSKSNMHNYVTNIATKVQDILGVQSDMDSVFFLETVLNDYNYLSQNK